MSPASVNRQTLRDQVLRILREEILAGVFAPGERLSEPELAKRLDVSLTPVREALGDLAASGLVVRNGRQGTHVRKVGVKDAANLLAVRRALEVLAVRQAVSHLTPADDDKIRRLVREQAKATELTKTDLDTAVPMLGRLNEEFHQLILERSQNQWLMTMLGSIQDLLLFVRTELRRSAPFKRRRASLAEHRRIAEALLARDEQAAATAMGVHVDELESHVVALLQRLEGPANERGSPRAAEAAGGAVRSRGER